MLDPNRIKNSGLTIILVTIIALFVIFQAGEHVADFIRWITSLFNVADINPNNARGFAAFVQLIAIAVFIGWAYNRFKR